MKNQKEQTIKISSRWKNSGGFTLIELLVVIAIIGILASVVLGALNAARKKAQNVQRISQLTQIKKALELYYDDHGTYPISNVNAWYARDCNNTMNPPDPNTIIPGLVPTYISKISSDPAMVQPTSFAGCLNYGSEGEEYSLALIDVPGLTSADYATYPAFLPPYSDGGPNRCTLDGPTPTRWAVWSEGACTDTNAGALAW